MLFKEDGKINGSFVTFIVTMLVMLYFVIGFVGVFWYTAKGYPLQVVLDVSASDDIVMVKKEVVSEMMSQLSTIKSRQEDFSTAWWSAASHIMTFFSITLGAFVLGTSGRDALKEFAHKDKETKPPVVD